MVRIAEIEVDSDSDSEDEVPAATIADARRISFSKKMTPSGGNSSERKRSPPPPPQLDDSGNSDSEGEEDDEEDDDLSLTRFGSAAAHPRREVEETEEGTISNPSNLSEEQLKAITEGAENMEMGEIFNHVAGCPCHGHSGQGFKAEKFWEIPGQEESGPRMAVVQVAA